MAVGLGGLLAYERSQRQALETSIAIAVRTKPAQRAGEVVSLASRETLAIAPFAPFSYFALTSRLARSNLDMSLPDVDFEAEPAGYRSLGAAPTTSAVTNQRPPARPRSLIRRP